MQEFNWKYAKATNHLTLVHQGYIVCVGLNKALSGHWACISKIDQIDVWPLAGKFVETIPAAVDWAETFISIQILQEQAKKDGAA